MEIRRADSRDIPGITALLYQVGQVHHVIRPDIFRSGALKYTPEELEALLREADKPVFVCDDGGQIAGHCFCQIRRYDGGGVSTERTEVYIDDLCIDESRRGQHIGSLLFEYAVAFARTQGCQFVTLNVWCGNDGAMKFYESKGLIPRNINMEMKLC